MKYPLPSLQSNLHPVFPLPFPITPILVSYSFDELDNYSFSLKLHLYDNYGETRTLIIYLYVRHAVSLL